MVSIAVPGGSTPRSAFHDAVDWGRVVVATLARGVVGTVLGLALWAAAPALIGWQPTTVMTGSMEPRLVPGDVVVSRPVPPAEVRPGRILLADDPDQPGHLRMHRYVEPGPDGTLVTKGDANPQADSTPLERDAVHGVAFLRIPFVAAPVTWLREGEWVRLVLFGLGFAAVLSLCAVDGSLRRFAAGDDAPGDDAAGDDAAGDDAAGDDAAGDDAEGDGRGPSRQGVGLEARGGPAPSLPAGGDGTTVTRRSLRRRGRRLRRARRLGGGAAVVLLAVGLGTLLPPSAVAAPFSRTTSSTTTYGAGTPVSVSGLSCAPASPTSVTISWSYPSTTDIGVPTSFDLMDGTTQVATAPGTASALVYSGSGLLTLGTVDLRIRTNLGGSWTVLSSQPVKVRVLSVAGSGSAGCG